MNLNRLEAIIGNENLAKVKSLKVLVLGLGGVGGYVVESLVRCGISTITLVDYDTIKPSNINRQIIANRFNNNKYKTKEWRKRLKLINKNIKVNLINTKLTPENIDILFVENYDYIVDACDTTNVKVKLIEECHNRNIKLVECMGTANKIDATKLELTTLDKTEYDPLAKKLRKEIKNKSILKDVVVVCSNEKPINSKILGSTSFVPATAGLLATNYIIRDVCNM